MIIKQIIKSSWSRMATDFIGTMFFHSDAEFFPSEYLERTSCAVISHDL